MSSGYCDQCGQQLTTGAKFCTSCGAPRQATATPAAQTAQADPLPRPAMPVIDPSASPRQAVTRTLLAQIRAHPGTVIKNAFSFRLIFTAFLIALVPAFLGSLIAPAVGSVLFFLTFIPVWLLSAANPMVVLYCPFCGKRVKMGADSCHHCGRAVTPTA